MIEFKEVEKRYPNGYEALKHINLTIDQGEFVAIIGLSGPADRGRHRRDDPPREEPAEVPPADRHDLPIF